MEISSEMLQRLKETELNILIEFDRVCKDLNVKYSLSSGTLLGAIRHQGFIPWDDDIDVAMLREDYNKFVSQGQCLMPDYLFIQTYETDKHYPLNFAKIRDTSTVLIEYSTKTLYMKNGVYIDIFPIDCVSSNFLKRWIDNIMISIILAVKFSCTVEWAQQSSSRLRGTVRRVLLPFARLLGTQRLNRIETKIRIKKRTKDFQCTYGDRFSLPPNRFKNNMLMPIDIFKSYDDILFEQRKFMAIKDWQTYLSVIYGDYMQLPPKNKRISLHDFIELRIK